MSSMRSNVSVRESAGSIVLNVSGVVLIGSPNLGTKVSGPWLNSDKELIYLSTVS